MRLMNTDCLNPACCRQISKQHKPFEYYFCSQVCFEESTQAQGSPLHILKDGMTTTGYYRHIGAPKEGPRPVYPVPVFLQQIPPKAKRLIPAAGCEPVH